MFSKILLGMRTIEQNDRMSLLGVRERGLRPFKSVWQAQQFLGAHAVVCKLFNLGRHLVIAQHYRNLSYYLMDYYNWQRPHQYNGGGQPAVSEEKI
jgi:hypothetical protein